MYKERLLNYIIILVFISIIIISFSIQSSIIAFLISFYFFGTLYCVYISSLDKSEFKNIFYIFLNSSLFYFIYSALAGYNYQSTNDFLIFPDQNYFYNISEKLKNLSSIGKIFEYTIMDQTHRESEGMHFLTGTVAFISKKYLDDNSVLLQSLIVSSFAIFTNVFLYKILRYYVDTKNALKYTFIFSILSVNFAYSPWILRDIHILFFYTLGFYLIHKPFSIINLLFIFLIQYIVSEFRVASGLMFIFFPLLYIYIKNENYKYKYLVYFSSFLFFIFIYINSISAIKNTLSKLENYEGFTGEAVNSAGGLSGAIYQLPPVIKETVIIVFSQMQPFPPWGDNQKIESLFEFLSISLFGVAAIFWFYVIYVSVISLRKNYIKTPKILLFGLIFFIAFLVGNSSNINIRRIMAVYPIAYTYFVFSQVQFNKGLINKRWGYFLFIYISLLAIYIFLK